MQGADQTEVAESVPQRERATGRYERHEPSTGAEHPGDLDHDDLQWFHDLERHRADHGVDRPIGEREPGGVPEDEPSRLG